MGLRGKLSLLFRNIMVGLGYIGSKISETAGKLFELVAQGAALVGIGIFLFVLVFLPGIIYVVTVTAHSGTLQPVDILIIGVFEVIYVLILRFVAKASEEYISK